MKAAYGTAGQSKPFPPSSSFIIMLGPFSGKSLKVDPKEAIINAIYIYYSSKHTHTIFKYVCLYVYVCLDTHIYISVVITLIQTYLKVFSLHTPRIDWKEVSMKQVVLSDLLLRWIHFSKISTQL